jgi:hypothetical protein
MVTVDFNLIKQGILGDKYQQFLIEFPEAKAEIEKFKTTPSCGSCERNVIPKLYSYPNYDEKIKLIYGQDITINKGLPPPQPSPMRLESHVYRIPISEWDEWFIKYTTPNSDMQIRLITTFAYGNDVVCSVSVMVRENKPV